MAQEGPLGLERRQGQSSKNKDIRAVQKAVSRKIETPMPKVEVKVTVTEVGIPKPEIGWLGRSSPIASTRIFVRRWKEFGKWHKPARLSLSALAVRQCVKYERRLQRCAVFLRRYFASGASSLQAKSRCLQRMGLYCNVRGHETKTAISWGIRPRCKPNAEPAKGFCQESCECPLEEGAESEETEIALSRIVPGISKLLFEWSRCL
jgi:hypothetical protein